MPPSHSSSVETCTSKCCGQNITCSEPTRATNRKIMYGISSFQFFLSTLLLIIVGASSCPWVPVTGAIMNSLIVPSLASIAVGSFALSFLLSFLASLLAFSTHRRAKSSIALLLVVQLLLSAILLALGSQAVYISLGSDISSDSDGVYHDRWLAAVGRAEEEESGDGDGGGGGALAFVRFVQTNGDCCEWGGSTETFDAVENPEAIGCDGVANTEPCREWVADNVARLSGGVGGTVVGITVVYVMSVMSSFGVLCRIKDMYASEKMDFGDFIDSRNGIKHVTDLTEA